MNKTVPFDIILSFLIGAFVVFWFSEEIIREPKWVANPYFIAVILFEGFFYLPLGIYLYYFYPAWSWMYFFNPSNLSQLQISALGVIMIFCYMLSLVAGFQVAQWLVRISKREVLRRILVIGAFVLLLFCIITIRRLLFIGDYKVWDNGVARFLGLHKVGFINFLMAIVGFGSLGVMLKSVGKTRVFNRAEK